MKTPLFFVHCTTCGARIRFYDESRIGQIIPCPKCGSMVMVECNVEENERRSESVPVSVPSSEEAVTEKVQNPSNPVPPVPPIPPQISIPTPPPIFQETSPQEENQDFSDDSTSEDTFQFEGEIDSKINSRQLLFIMGGIAAGIFLCVTILLFALHPSKTKKVAHPLQVPVAVTTAGQTKGEVSVTEVGKKNSKDSDTQTFTSKEDTTVPVEESVPTEESETEEILSETAISDSAGDEISTLMQSSMGKKLTGSFPENAKGKDEKGIEEGESVIAPTEVTETSPEDLTTSEIPTNPLDSEPSKDGIESEEADESTAESDADQLQFSRKKRKRTYSGDPVLDFDEVTREVEIPGEVHAEVSGVEKVEDSEEATHVPSPTDEVVQEKPEVPVLQSFRIKPPTVEYLPPDATAKLAVPLESVSIQKRPVTALLQMASQMSGERLVVDWQKLQQLGVSMETPVTLKLEDTTLREVLDTGLYSVNLGVIPSGLTLRVGGSEAALVFRQAKERGEKPEKHILNLEDLVAVFNTETSGKSGLAEMERIIPQFVHPALWEETGGPGRLTSSPGKSRITISQQFPSVIQEVELFCDKIRYARKMETKVLPTNPAQRRQTLNDGTEIYNGESFSRYSASLNVRKTSIDCDLSDGTTLRSALEEIMRCAGAKIIIDEQAIARIPITDVWQDAEVPDFDGNKKNLPDSILDLPCIYRFENITMEEAVSTVLKSVPLLCYPLSKNEFFLTTYDEAHRKMLVDFFPIGDLMKNPSAAGTLVNGICEGIAPESWTRNGGNGAIYFDLPSHTLIVRQNPYILYQIEMFLDHFRKTKNANERQETKSE